MHNNFTLDKTPKPQKAFYTVVEAAILWARSEGAKSASDPRIAHYNRLILEALKNGELCVHEVTSINPSYSTTIASADLKHWLATHFTQI